MIKLLGRMDAESVKLPQLVGFKVEWYSHIFSPYCSIYDFSCLRIKG